MEKQLSFLILEDHSLVMNAIKSIVSEKHHNARIEGFKSIESLKAAITNFDVFDLIISDLQLEFTEANDFLSELKADYSTPILVVSMHNSYRTITEVMEIGVDGYILKDDADYFHEAIETLLQGGTYFSPKVKKTIDSVEAQNMTLSKRQLDVLKLWQMHYSNAEIAEKLFVSIETIKSHKRNIRTITNQNGLNEIVEILKKGKII